jgi:hypothetical protein
MNRLARETLDGAAGGVVGTAAMSGFMLGAHRAGLIGKQPPQKILEHALHRAGIAPRHVDKDTRKALSTIDHFAFGAAAGGLFGAFRAATGMRRHAALEGVAFGSLVWLVSYAGWVPALGIMPPPHRDRRGRPTAMVVAHWIYGGVLGAVQAWLGRKRSGTSQGTV